MKHLYVVLIVAVLSAALIFSALRSSPTSKPTSQTEIREGHRNAVDGTGRSMQPRTGRDDEIPESPLQRSAAQSPGGIWLDETGQTAETGSAKAAAIDTPIPSPTAVAVPTLNPTATPIDDSPAVSALRELQSTPVSNSSLLGGVKAARPEVVSRSPARPTATPVESPTATPALPRVGGQSTGYTMLYLMHPRARLTTERQVQALLDANLDEVYLGVLVDGTFSLDFPYLESVVRRLSADDHALTLVLYFSNGSAMRDYDRTSSKVAFNLAPPEAFRALIEEDPATRLTFQAMVSRAIPIFDLNLALNARNSNIAIPMLEDNLDRTSYQAMRDLMRAVLGTRAAIARNPCPGCASGNDDETLGDILDSHSPQNLNALSSRDGFSLDGTGYELPGDPPNQQPSLEAIKQLKAFSVAHGIRYFGLWRRQRQGLGSTLINPDERTYEVPTDDQIDIEVQLLRWGLNVLDPTPTPVEGDGG